MQTSFTENQLKDKDNRTSETIIRKCVHCGMCNATCPTYGINGEEFVAVCRDAGFEILRFNEQFGSTSVIAKK